MKPSWLFLPFFLILLSFSLASDFSGRVVAILNGNSIEVLHNRTIERIRPAGIDCPEKKQAFGTRAKQAIATLSFRQQVTVCSAGKDRYKRSVGTVELIDGTNLDHELVCQGWCWWYWKYAPEEIFLAILKQGPETPRKAYGLIRRRSRSGDGGSAQLISPYVRGQYTK